MKMAERIKELRLKHGLTQEELGNIIGVQKSAIRKYESGIVKNMKRSSIDTLSKYFGVAPSYLMGLDEEEQQNAPGKVTDLSEGEMLLVELFRQLDEDSQTIYTEVLRQTLLSRRGGGENQR